MSKPEQKNTVVVMNRRPTILGYAWNTPRKRDGVSVRGGTLNLKPGRNVVDASVLEAALKTRGFRQHVELRWIEVLGLDAKLPPVKVSAKRKSLKGAHGSDGKARAGVAESAAEAIARIERSNDLSVLEAQLETEERKDVSAALLKRIGQLEAELDQGEEASDADQDAGGDEAGDEAGDDAA